MSETTTTFLLEAAGLKLYPIVEVKALHEEIKRLRGVLKEAECSAQHIMQLRADTGKGDGSVEHLSAKSYTDLAYDLFIKLNEALK